MAKRAELLKQLQALPRESVKVPVLGTVVVRGLSGIERDKFEKSCIEGRGKKREVNVINLRARLAVLCTYDATDTERLFEDGDAQALGEGRADVVDLLYGVGARLAGISKEDEDDLGKSSETETPGSSSSSVSLEN
jgi:hypothetical protein